MTNKRKATIGIVVHSSQTTADQDWSVVDIERHDRQRGKLSCGFHKIITRNGAVENGRHIEVSGLHLTDTTSSNFTNQNTIAICLIGGEPDCNFTYQQFVALKKLYDELTVKYGKLKIVGHNEIANTDMPRFNVNNFFTGSSTQSNHDT